MCESNCLTWQSNDKRKVWQAFSESIKKSQSYTPLLIRRVAGGLRNLLLLYIAYHVELFNTLDSVYTQEKRFIPLGRQAEFQSPNPLLLPIPDKLSPSKLSSLIDYQKRKKKSLRSLRLNLFRTPNSIRRGRLLFFFFYIHTFKIFILNHRSREVRIMCGRISLLTLFLSFFSGKWFVTIELELQPRRRHSFPPPLAYIDVKVFI
jgi:hypothetical protein